MMPPRRFTSMFHALLYSLTSLTLQHLTKVVQKEIRKLQVTSQK